MSVCMYLLLFPTLIPLSEVGTCLGISGVHSSIIYAIVCVINSALCCQMRTHTTVEAMSQCTHVYVEPTTRYVFFMCRTTNTYIPHFASDGVAETVYQHGLADNFMHKLPFRFFFFYW
jgi:hypothetical protein